MRMAASLPNAKVGAIIVAAGASSRMGAAGDKTLADLAGEPLIARTVDVFERCAAVACVALVVSERNRDAVAALREAKEWRKTAPPVLGGARRQDSVRAGLEALPKDCGWVVVHDGARPFITPAMIEAGLEAAHPTGAAVAVVPAFDTVKRVAPDGGVIETLDRSELRMAQTPQVFRRDVLERAHAEVTDDATDDAAMAERIGVEVRTFAGDRANIKITTAEDLEAGGGTPLLNHSPIVYAEVHGTRKMAEQHEREISVIDRGLDELYQMLHGSPSRLPTEYDYDLPGYANGQLWRMLLANRILKSLRSARILAVRCHYEQALILCRTALEHILVAYDAENLDTLRKLNKREHFTNRDFIEIAERAQDMKPMIQDLLFLRKYLNGFVHPSHTSSQFKDINGDLYLSMYSEYDKVSTLSSLLSLAFLVHRSLQILRQAVSPYRDKLLPEIIATLGEVLDDISRELEISL